MAAYLKGHGHSQAWLSQRLKVDRSMVSMLLSGQRTPSLALAADIQKLTGIPAVSFAKPSSWSKSARQTREASTHVS